MAAFTALALGLALGAGVGAIAARRKKGPQPQPPVLAPGPTTAADAVQQTLPPTPVATESASLAAARMASARTRRKAATGPAGKVRRAPGAAPSAQTGYGASRTLIGS